MNRAESLKQLRSLRRLKELKKERGIREARSDFFAFQRAVMKTEDGEYWEPGEHHVRWDEASYRPRSVTFAPVEHGKTEQRTIARSLFDIGISDGWTRQAIISESQDQSKKMLSAVKHYVEHDEDYRRVFPDIHPGKPWGETAIKVKGTERQKDYTVQALGVNGRFVGARLDRAILDDVLSFQNTLNAEQRVKVFNWIVSTLVGRIVDFRIEKTRHGAEWARGRLEVVGTAWHLEDAMHELAKLDAYAVIRDAACALTIGDEGIDASDILWPAQWNPERLLARREEIGELEFSRQMLNIALSDALARFKQEWWDRAFGVARELGHEFYSPTDKWSGGVPVYAGLDLGVGKKKIHDRTVFTVHAAHRNGTKQLLQIRSGRWDMAEIVSEAKAVYKQFGCIILVESNAAQDYLRQALVNETDVNVRRHVTTSKNKFDPEFGIESMAVELQNGKWSVPRTKETEALAMQAVYYDPTAHTGDHLMSWWISRECSRRFRSVGKKSRSAQKQRSPAAAIRDMEF